MKHAFFEYFFPPPPNIDKCLNDLSILFFRSLTEKKTFSLNTSKTISGIKTLNSEIMPL